MILAPVLLLVGARSSADTLNVFAAASLREALTTIAATYERENDGVKVNLNFAGSQVLAAQIDGGAPADVFASADQKNLDKIEYRLKTRRVFAKNRLAIVFRTGLPASKSLSDFAKVKRIVVADRTVPVGTYTETFLSKAAKHHGQRWLTDIRSKIVSYEQDVKAVLVKVKLGEADAGIVYYSDALTAGTLVVYCDIPPQFNVLAEYPAAVPNRAGNPKGGEEFIRFLLTKDSQHVLRANGFVSSGLK